jgi:two-component system, NarL family, invasion response regulator UvrY
MKSTIALADDHALLRNGLANLLEESGYDVLFQANNGEELINKINAGSVPDLVLMDINMPVTDGYTATLFLKNNFPNVRVLALSMYDDEEAIIRMLKNGARGYILKDAHPTELNNALHVLMTNGFYHSEMVTGRLIHALNKQDDEEGRDVRKRHGLNEREMEFLRLICTEMTYKEIADQMYLSPRTIDGYRDSLFEKLNIKSRVGLVLFALKNGIVNLGK